MRTTYLKGAVGACLVALLASGLPGATPAAAQQGGGGYSNPPPGSGYGPPPSDQGYSSQPGAANDFTTFDFTQFLQRAQQQTTIMTLLLVGIAAISLTVGGIGIMNIMLVSVTERTREIGIRMSVGARRRDIRNQFLIESLTLCLVGGAIGMLLGLLIGFAVTHAAGLPFVVSVTSILTPFIVSSAIGVIFGLYPAMRASKLDPIVALRTE